LLLRRRVTGVGVRVVPLRQLAVGLLDVRLGRALLDAKGGVVILVRPLALRHASLAPSRLLRSPPAVRPSPSTAGAPGPCRCSRCAAPPRRTAPRRPRRRPAGPPRGSSGRRPGP